MAMDWDVGGFNKVRYSGPSGPDLIEALKPRTIDRATHLLLRTFGPGPY